MTKDGGHRMPEVSRCPDQRLKGRAGEPRKTPWSSVWVLRSGPDGLTG